MPAFKRELAHRIESDEVTDSLLDLRCATPQLAICQPQFTGPLEISDRILVLVYLTAVLVHMDSISFFYLRPCHSSDLGRFLANRFLDEVVIGLPTPISHTEPHPTPQLDDPCHSHKQKKQY